MIVIPYICFLIKRLLCYVSVLLSQPVYYPLLGLQMDCKIVCIWKCLTFRRLVLCIRIAALLYIL